MTIIKIHNSVYQFTPMTEFYASEVLSWRYLSPYDVYNPDENRFSEDLAYFTDPDNQMLAVLDENDALIGYCSFGTDGQVPGGDYSFDALDIGLGTRPDLTGRGLGHKFLTAIIRIAMMSFKPTAFRVTIADFNLRAQKLCTNTGFRITDTFIKSNSDRVFNIYLLEDLPKEDL